MKTMILVGSKGRIDYPLARWFKLKYTLLVEPQEAEAYREAHPGQRIEVLKRDDGGFAYLNNSMIGWALREGVESYWFLDDDLLNLSARVDGKLVRARTAEEQARIFRRAEKLMDEHHLAQTMISFRPHNWQIKKDWVSHQGCWGCYLNRVGPALVVGGYDRVLTEFNDWELSARLIKNGFTTGRDYRAAFGHKMRGYEGGAKLIPMRATAARKSVEYLMFKYPEEVRKIYHAGHESVEPRFNWRRLRVNQEGRRPIAK